MRPKGAMLLKIKDHEVCGYGLGSGDEQFNKIESQVQVIIVLSP
jgi:hypothetical protein